MKDEASKVILASYTLPLTCTSLAQSINIFPVTGI